PVPGDILQCKNRITPGAPTSLLATSSATGGTLAAGTYVYVVTATLPNGETMASNEVIVSVGGTHSSVALTWVGPTSGSANGYKVYRGTGIGSENVLVQIITSPTILAFTDTGAATVPGAPPTVGITAGRPIWANVPMPIQFPM